MTKKQPKDSKKKPKPSAEAELKELLQRTQAGFENYKKQTEKRIEDIQEMASKRVIIQLLPILDNLELALKNAPTEENEFTKGIVLIHSQFHQLLEDNGIETIKTENETFDPHLHEALMKTPSDKPENTIIEEFQKGYMLNDIVIRHAKVKLSAGTQ